MKKKYKTFTLLITFLTASSTLISCGRTENTEARVKQINDAQNADLAKIAEKFWLNSTLKQIYNIDEDNLLENSKFQKEAYNAYVSKLENDFLNDPFALYKKIANWKREGVFNASDLKILDDLKNDISISKTTPNLEQFQVLYKKNKTDINLETNKILIVKKYFEINNPEQLKIINKTSYENNKDTYELKDFNLIDYLIKEKLAQLWRYSSNSENDVFSNLIRRVSKIDDYKIFFENTDLALKIAPKSLLFNNKNFESSLGSYQGISKDLKDYQLNFSQTYLLSQTNFSNLSGFYDFTNNKIVKIDDNENLNESIKVTKDEKNINISYLNLVAPIAKEITNSENKTIKILSFDNTPYASKLDNLKYAIIIYGGDTLYKTVQNAYVDLGYTLKIKNTEIVGKKLEGLSFVK
ncbi:HinT-interacting membrane complex lipoprotein P60 [Mycoplasmopsis cricetuli]|uniref:HinT-interacting membrane complex lipoprotein P60 n=1 Tax=Mycoplasmopsis cricetuli TaxID=171283 RepID=UPI000472051F|nr:hypothetical protein [Mycoplasmopsis cricetuli]